MVAGGIQDEANEKGVGDAFTMVRTSDYLVPTCGTDLLGLGEKPFSWPSMRRVTNVLALVSSKKGEGLSQQRQQIAVVVSPEDRFLCQKAVKGGLLYFSSGKNVARL